MKKVVGLLTVCLMAGSVYTLSCLFCIASNNYISDEEYSRMAQELVEQSLEPVTPCSRSCIDTRRE